MRNTGTAEAVGCWVAPDVPLNAKVSTQLLRNNGTPRGPRNRNFEVPAGGKQLVRLTIDGRGKGKAMKIPIRVECLNADGPLTAGADIVTLTF